MFPLDVAATFSSEKGRIIHLLKNIFDSLLTTIRHVVYGLREVRRDVLCIRDIDSRKKSLIVNDAAEEFLRRRIPAETCRNPRLRKALSLICTL